MSLFKLIECLGKSPLSPGTRGAIKREAEALRKGGMDEAAAAEAAVNKFAGIVATDRSAVESALRGEKSPSLIDRARQSRENSLQAIRDLQKRTGSGPEQLAELVYHSAKVAASLAAEFGLKGAELAARTIKEVGEWAKEHIDSILNLAESLEHPERSEELVKSVGEDAARAEDFQNRIQEAADKAAKEASDKLIKEVGAEVARGEDFQRKLEKQAREAADKARKEASDRLIVEAGAEAAKPEDFAARVAAEGAKRDRELETFRKAVDKRAAALRERIAKEDFETKKRQPYMDREKAEILAGYNGAVLEYERAKKKWEMENRSPQQKAFDAVADWKRISVLSSLPVIGKLTTAALEMIVLTPGENLVGGALGKIPGISRVAERAPRHGRFSYSAEAKAIAETWNNFFKDIVSIHKTGKTEYELLHENGEKIRVGSALGEYLGRLHAILKSPAKRNEFARSFAYRVEHYSRSGITDDVMTSADWQMRIGAEALRDAKHQLFLEDNVFTDKWRDFWNGVERTAKEREKTGDPVSPFALRTAKFLANWEMPIVRIPTNIVARIFEYALGSATGAVRLGVALYKGVENLAPEQADLIMRNLKRGTVGIAFYLIGYFNQQNVGGYYQRGKYPAEDEPDFGELTVGGIKIPKWAVHNPLLEMLQLGATVAKVSAERQKKSSPELKGSIRGIHDAVLGLAEEVPFINEIKHLADTALDPDSRKSFFGEMMKSAIPAVVQQAARWMDPEAGKKDARGRPVTRKPDGPLETIEMGIPGLRNTIPVKRK